MTWTKGQNSSPRSSRKKKTDPIMASIFDEAVRHVRQVRAQKNLIALEAAMRKKAPLDKEIVADAARWITEPEPFEIAHKADEKVMAKNQFLRLHAAITAAAKNYVSPELLAAVVAKCEDNLIFYKAEKMMVDDLQELIGKKIRTPIGSFSNIDRTEHRFCELIHWVPCLACMSHRNNRKYALLQRRPAS